MQKIVIDTNVLVSALIQKSFPYLIVNYIPDDIHTEWCISDEVFVEYSNVLRRVKFSKYPEFALNAEKLLIDIETAAIKYAVGIRLSIIKDQDDNKFLELAATCNANFLITGNTRDFKMDSFKQTKVVTPKEYWEQYLEKPPAR